jgi:hypothetical protein
MTKLFSEQNLLKTRICITTHTYMNCILFVDLLCC